MPLPALQFSQKREVSLVRVFLFHNLQEFFKEEKDTRPSINSPVHFDHRHIMINKKI